MTAELSRLAGWTAFDVGQHDAAQRHFIQALRLARAGGDVQLGSYVLTTMAMQSLMRGFAAEAVDMAQGAFERAKGQATTALAPWRRGRPSASSSTAPARSSASPPETTFPLLEEGGKYWRTSPVAYDFFVHHRVRMSVLSRPFERCRSP